MMLSFSLLSVCVVGIMYGNKGDKSKQLLYS